MFKEGIIKKECQIAYCIIVWEFHRVLTYLWIPMDLILSVFSLQNTVCFIILRYLVPVLFTFSTQGVLNLKK